MDHFGPVTDTRANNTTPTLKESVDFINGLSTKQKLMIGAIQVSIWLGLRDDGSPSYHSRYYFRECN